MSIAQQWLRIQECIAQYATTPHVTVVAVSKYASIAQVKEAYAAGIRHFGENKVLDALDKIQALDADEFPGIQWHFIGSLQSNKVKKTVGQFALIHSIDRLSLAKAVSQANQSAGRVQPVLLQVNISDDPSRHGFTPATLEETMPELLALPHLEIRGLMAMAPAELSLSGNDEALHEKFMIVKNLQKKLQIQHRMLLPELSMGMSNDFVQALACDATIIRIGNYLFKT